MKNKLLWLLTLNAGLFASVPNPADVIVRVVRSIVEWGLFLWIIGCFIWIAWIYPANQQTTIRDYLKPGFIVVFAIIVIIISSHFSNAYKTLIASNKKPVLSRLGI